MTDVPEPLTPPDCDLRDFPRMMIDIGRLRQSSLDATLDDRVYRAALNLYFTSWHSLPCGSLDAEPAALMKAAGLGRDLKTWREIEGEALRGFVRCSDGSLYHRVVAEFALEGWIEKLLQRLISGAGNAKRWETIFDSGPIETALQDAAARLEALAPQSKTVAKARRKLVRSDRTAIPPGQQTDPAGTPLGLPVGRMINPDGNTRRPVGTPAVEEKTFPKHSQGEGEGKEVIESRQSSDIPREAIVSATPLAEACDRIREAAGMRAVPRDQAFVRRWLALPDMQLDRDIIPVVRRVADRKRTMSSEPPGSFACFDAAVREQHALDAARIEALGKVAARAIATERPREDRPRPPSPPSRRCARHRAGRAPACRPGARRPHAGQDRRSRSSDGLGDPRRASIEYTPAMMLEALRMCLRVTKMSCLLTADSDHERHAELITAAIMRLTPRSSRRRKQRPTPCSPVSRIC